NGKTSSFTSLFFGVGYYGSFVTNDDLPFYLIYAGLGAILGDAKINATKRNYLVVVYIFISLVTAYLTYLISTKNGKFTESFFTYSSVLVMWASAVLFIYIKDIDRPVFGPITNTIAGATLPIYGLHPLVLEYLITNNFRLSSAPLDIILVSSFTFLVCLIIGIIINKLDRWRFLS
ncbi:acyltransferase family protein, partial [Citrobacter sedlakii]